MHKSELELLRWIAKRVDGATVADAIERFGGSRQSVYSRLERAVRKGLLSYTFERGTGPRPRARYALTAAGVLAAEQKWVAVGPRSLAAKISPNRRRPRKKAKA